MHARRHSGAAAAVNQRHDQQASGSRQRRKSEAKVYRTELSFNNMAGEKKNENVEVKSSDGRTPKTVKVKPRKGSTSTPNGTSPAVENGRRSSSGESTPKRHSVDGGVKLEGLVGSRAQRLRKSLIANSMSSLTPLCEYEAFLYCCFHFTCTCLIATFISLPVRQCLGREISCRI